MARAGLIAHHNMVGNVGGGASWMRKSDKQELCSNLSSLMREVSSVLMTFSKLHLSILPQWQILI